MLMLQLLPTLNIVFFLPLFLFSFFFVGMGVEGMYLIGFYAFVHMGVVWNFVQLGLDKAINLPSVCVMFSSESKRKRPPALLNIYRHSPGISPYI